MSEIKHTVIVANGKFPMNERPLRYLDKAERIICADGAVRNLVNYGIDPWAIIGDMDSITDDMLNKYSDRIFRDTDQETNDLTKAVNFAISRNIESIIILGATGEREDHALGNISLLAEYARQLEVLMVTDHGIFMPVYNGKTIPCTRGQQVSVINPGRPVEVDSSGLKYRLNKLELSAWWRGTLNECTGSAFSLSFKSENPLLVFMVF